MEQSKENVYIVIPVHNRKDITLECLKGLDGNGDMRRYHIVVVDDGSTDGTEEAVGKQFPEVEILTGDGNLWWTGSMAKGMKYGCGKGAEFLVWLNDDCVPEPNTLPGMIRFLKARPGTLAAPACYSRAGTEAALKENGFRGRISFRAEPGKVTEVDGFSGWCVGMPAKVCEKIGFPDAERFPHYWGDTVYTLKARRAGFRLCLVGDIKVRLTGEVEEHLSVGASFLPGQGPGSALGRLFLAKGSPCYLKSLFHYMVERYGVIPGFGFFLYKVCIFTGKWLCLTIGFYAQRIRRIKDKA